MRIQTEAWLIAQRQRIGSGRRDWSALLTPHSNEDAMRSIVEGSDYRNPALYRGFRIFKATNPAFPAWDWSFETDDFDPECPADDDNGCAGSLEACKRAIDALLDGPVCSDCDGTGRVLVEPADPRRAAYWDTCTCVWGE